MLTYYLLRIASVVVPRLPLVVGYWLADLAADISFALQPRARQHVTANIRRVMEDGIDEAEVRAIAREVFRTGAKNYYDMFRVPRLTTEDIRELVKVRGVEHLDEMLQAGKGAILVTAHLGNIDVVAQVAATLSLDVTIPVEHVHPEKLFNLVTRIRNDKGLKFVPVGAGALKAIHQALKKNEVVAIAADRDILGNGAEVTFFGKDTTLPAAPAILALRTGAPVLPVRSLRYPGGRYAIDIGTPIELQASGDVRADIRANTQRITNTLEYLIREHPEQWIVFQPVWDMQD